ncbi:MAG: MFS transporter [Betaproteobacteria bacterium]|nr:MFS transporter [Betaproteobacteria bacterium]
MFDVRREEVPALLWAFCYFFCLLCAYYVLRPVRDEMGIQGGLHNIQWLWTGTFVGMLIVTPLFGWITSRWPRRTFLPLVYLFFIANLVLFYFAMLSESLDKQWVAASFFIWLSVFNYFVVSVFWSFMTDIFDSSSAKRLFGAISAGGSIGAMTGPVITATLVKQIGIPNLLLISAVLMGCAIVCVVGLGRWARNTSTDKDADAKAMGGSVLDGIRLAARSPYLLSICGYMFLLQALGTFFYLEQVRIMAENISSSAERTQLFAQLDLAVNTLTLLTQLFATGTLLKRFGVVVCLSIVPALCVVTLGITAIWPTLMVISIGTVLRRACEFAVGKPAREILFTVVSRAERYKSKNFIDTVVSRGADVVSTWSNSGLRGLGLGASQIAIVCIPLSVGMIAVGMYLGREQEKRVDAPASSSRAA